VVTDPATGRSTTATGAGLLTARQIQMMATDPELIRQTAHLIANEHDRLGPGDSPRLEVRAEAYQSLNGHPAARLIDPEVDLAAEPFRIGHQRWVLPPQRDPL
jgi:vitamin K-dependent gamma-carboxylase